jgi:hypothetical protein
MYVKNDDIIFNRIFIQLKKIKQLQRKYYFQVNCFEFLIAFYIEWNLNLY